VVCAAHGPYPSSSSLLTLVWSAQPMGPNLLALIKHYNYRGIPMDMVRSITRQVNPPKENKKKTKKDPLHHQTGHPKLIQKHFFVCFVHRFWKGWIFCTRSARLFTQISSPKTSCSAQYRANFQTIWKSTPAPTPIFSVRGFRL